MQSGPATSRIFRWRLAFCIWWRSSIGPAGVWPALVEHDGCGLLHRGARRALARHGTPKYLTPIGRAVHQRRLHRQARGCRHRDFDGRPRSFHGQHFHRSDLWRSIIYEEVHLKAYADGREARDAIGSWMNFYNQSPPASGDEQPVSHGGMACRHRQDRGGKDCGNAASLGHAIALPTYHSRRKAAAEAA